MNDVPAKVSNISKRGFASMSPERRREIARMGGAAVPGNKRSFSQDRSLASTAGALGGSKTQKVRRGSKAPASSPGDTNPTL